MTEVTTVYVTNEKYVAMANVNVESFNIYNPTNISEVAQTDKYGVATFATNFIGQPIGFRPRATRQAGSAEMGSVGAVHIFVLTLPRTGDVPIGGIIMWSGSIASIPTGYQLCDGTNGTSDLRASFIIGAGAAFPVDTVGGAVIHNHAFTHESAHGITVIQPNDHASHVHGPGASVAVDATGAGAVHTVWDAVNSGVPTTTLSHAGTDVTLSNNAPHSGGAVQNATLLPPYFAKAFIQRMV